MMKSFWSCTAVSMPGMNLQSWIPSRPSTFCGSLFDIRYSTKLALNHMEGERNRVQTFARVY
jgi:hypothetical protein